jgi:hypothetical protein
MRVLLFSIVIFASGCAAASMQKRTYDVTVKNQSSKSVTVWLTKDGPAWENGWKSPEDLAAEKPGFDAKISGVIVFPGETVGTGPVSGLFAPPTAAILRVYMGQRKIAELLAMSTDHPDRIDTELRPGVNVLIVSDRGSGIQVARSP